MPRQYLFGPVSAEFTADHLSGLRQSGECLTFDHFGNVDLRFGAEEDWEDLCARLPAGWRPDFVAVHLPYTTIPPWLWTAPVPLIGLAMDWNLLWHDYLDRLPLCDLVLTDAKGVEVLGRAGIHHARAANLFGCSRLLLDEMPTSGVRDIDILFAGNANRAVHRDRLPWLARLARLSDRYQVQVRTDVWGADYRALLARSRIVFNRSIRGECNQRAFEAAASGALLFQEVGNREVPEWFRDRVECVYYDGVNLEALLAHYLSHEEERRTIAEAAQRRAHTCGWETLWQQALDRSEIDWRLIQERAARRRSGLGLPGRV